MATNGGDDSRSRPSSAASSDKDIESGEDSQFDRPRNEISEKEDTESELGEEKPVKRRERGKWEVVQQWDPRVIEKEDIDKEVLDLSNHYMQLSGTKELPGFYKKEAARLGMWPRKSNMIKSKGTTRVLSLISLCMQCYLFRLFIEF